MTEPSDNTLQTPKRSRPRLVPVVFAGGIASVVLMSLLAGLTVHMLFTIADLAQDTRDRVLPIVLERQRTAVNVERLGRFGEIILTTQEKRLRRETRLYAQILAQDSVFEIDPTVHQTALDTYRTITRIADIRDRNDARRDMILIRLDHTRTLLDMVHEVMDGLPAQSPLRARLNDLSLSLAGARVVLAESMLMTETEDIEAGRELYLELSRQISEQAVALGERPGLGRLLSIPDGLAKGEESFDLRVGIAEALATARTLWANARSRLNAVVDNLSTDAAAITARRFTTITQMSEQAMAAAMLGLGGVVMVFVILALLARRYVVAPLLRAARALQDIEHAPAEVELPPARLFEMDAVNNAVNRLGHLLGQLAERTQQLEREVAERQRVQEDLRAAKETADAANRAKSNFLATMSHEIRTPMNSIVGLTDIVLESPLAEEQRDYLATVRESSYHLLALINDILDFSKIEAGRLELENAHFRLDGCLTQALHTLRPQAEAKGLALRFEVDESLPEVVRGDPARLRQILMNLVGNAIKFTPSGSVVVQVDPDRTPPPPGMHGRGAIRFTVSDTGIGIPKAKLDTIFESFRQAEESTTRQYGGTGLGLAICRQLVQLMGGQLDVRSELGQGSTFSVLLFMAPGDARLVAREDEPDTNLPARERFGLKVLLVEDNPANVKVGMLHLERLGHVVTVAENGREALDLLVEREFDVVLMDLEMPVMGGLECTRIIRAREEEILDPDIPIVAMTAHALVGARDLCLRGGMDGFVSKPVNFRELGRVINRVVAGIGMCSMDDGPRRPEPADTIFSAEDAIESLGIEPEDFPSILRANVQEVDDRLDQLADALNRNDLATAALHAHSIKGSCANIGAGRCRAMALQVENAAKEIMVADAEQALARLRETFAETRAQARDWLDRREARP